MTTTTIATAHDAFVREDTGGTNYGNETYLRAKDTGADERQSFIMFPITLPSDATVISATLRLTLYSADWTGQTLTAERVTGTWTERAITWNNKPATTATNSATSAFTASAGSEIELSITNMVQDWVAGAAKLGLRLTTNSTALKSFYSSEAREDRRPVLVIEYALPAESPDNLSPDSGAAVSLEEPVFTWDGATPTEIRIQIDTVDTFDSMLGAPAVWDTDWTLWTETSYNSADDASPPLLAEGETYYWRVKTKDGNGVEGEWSGAAEFIYEPHGILTITQPAADNDDVATTTPTITHTFTDQTQSAVEYELYEDGVLVYTRPALTTVDTSFEIPVDYVRSATRNYTILVRVWDNLPRAAGGALPYVEAERIFQFAADGVPDPVTSLVATTDDGHVRLTWSRTVEPDFFAIEVNGVIVTDLLNASDLSTGGTNYAYSTYRATPQTNATIKVHAVTISAGVKKYPNDSPSVTVSFAPVGVWLADETDGTEVFFSGQAVDTDLGESGATFFPLSRQDPVRITDTVRGFEGRVTGQIMDYSGTSAATYLGLFEDMKANPGHDFRLIYGFRNFPVIIGASSVTLDPIGEETYTVSFEFWQVGEFTVVQ